MAGANDALGAVTLASTSAAGVGGDHQSYQPVFSPDGRHVAFYSSATNLVPGDTNGAKDIFVKDLVTGEITRVSTNVAGVQGDLDSFTPVFSPDGTKIAFLSNAGNLVANDADLLLSLFVKDLVTGAVTMVSSDATGAPVAVTNTTPTFSPDGTKVAFVTESALTPDDTNTRSDLYLKDLATGAVTRLTTGGGVQYDPVWSPDGSKIALRSSSALTAEDTGWYTELYVQDIATGAVTLVSRAANKLDGTPGAFADASVGQAVFSADGTKIAFWSFADNLSPGDANGSRGNDLFVKDLVTGAVTLVTSAANGAQGTDGGGDPAPAFSPDGTKILFRSNSTVLVPGDTNGVSDLFVKDLVTGEVTRVSTAADGTQVRSPSLGASWSPDGSRIVFLSGDKDLVPGFTPLEGDIFVKQLTVTPPANTAPVAGDDAYGAVAGSPLSVTGAGVLGNDIDANGDALTAILVSNPSHGTLALDPTGAFVYTAEAGFHGQDSFTYEASDGQAQSGLATVTLTVDGAPVATDDHYTTRQNVPLTVTAGAGLLANDHDPDGDPFTATLVSGPQHGTLALGADGSFTYTPTTGYLGSDSFTYRADDGITQGNVATVSLGLTANAGDIVRVSTDSGDGEIARGGGNPAFSPDGTKVAFWSRTDYAGEGDGARLYVKDLVTRTATVVWQETESNYGSSIAFARDNRTIAFKASSGLVIEDTQTGSAQTFPFTDGIFGIKFSPDGSKIAFYTNAALVPSDTNGVGDVYILDRATNSVNRVSTAKDGSQGTGTWSVDYTYTLDFSPDGSKIVFSSSLNGLTHYYGEGLIGNGTQAYIKDLNTGDITQVTHGDHDPVYDLVTLSYIDGSNFGANAPVTGTVFSRDGSKVAFVSQATNLVPGITRTPNPIFPNSDYISPQVFVLDLATGEIVVASSTPDGTDAVGPADIGGGYQSTGYAVFSPDGKKIAFRSAAANLVPNDTNDMADIFVKDLTTGSITRVNTTADGGQTSDNPDRIPSFLSFSPDGSKILFSSEVSSFVSDDTNQAIDVFLKTVRYPPTAVGDRWSPYPHQLLVIDAGRGVLANDVSPSGAALTATLVSGPAHGTLDFHADGSFGYTSGLDPANPGQYFYGLDQFTYKVSDGVSDSATATVKLYIVRTGGGNWDFPHLGGSSGPRVYGDPHLQTFDGLAYDFQAVGEFTLVKGVDFEVQVRQQAVGQNASSITAVAVKIDGSVVELDAGAAHPLLVDGVALDLADGGVQTIGHGFVSRAGNVYTVVDEAGNGFTAGLGSTFLDLQPFLSSDAAGQVAGLLGNDDGSTSNDIALADGTVLSGPVATATLYGAYADSWRVTDATSLFAYADGQTTETFTDRSFPHTIVSLGDLAPDVVAAAKQTALDAGLVEGTLAFDNAVYDVAVTGNAEYAQAAAGMPAPTTAPVQLVVDTAPVGVADAYATRQGETLTIAAANGVLANDTDAEGNGGLTAPAASQPQHGSLTLDADGSFTYTPNADFVGADSFTYTPSDGTLAGAATTVSLTVTPGNASPVATGDSLAVWRDTPLSFAASTLIANDSDPDGDPLTVTGVSDATHGTVAYDPASGLITFTPAAGFEGPASFTYTISDGQGGTSRATVAVDVEPASTGVGWGDVHYTTFDGTRYDLQAKGDFVIVRSVVGAELEVQGRAEGRGSLSYLTAVAVRAGGHTILTDVARPGVVVVDGAAVVMAAGDTHTFDALSVERVGKSEYRILSGADHVDILVRSAHLDVSVLPDPNRSAGSLQGLLGNLDGDPTNDLVLGDGTSISASNLARIEGAYADTWRVSGADSVSSNLGDASLTDRKAAYAAGAAGETLAFTDGATTLRIDAARGANAVVSGMAGGDAIDLMNFGSSATLGFVEDRSNAFGTLTLHSSTHTAIMTLLGQYSAANFTAVSDNSGGLLVSRLPQIADNLLASAHG